MRIHQITRWIATGMLLLALFELPDDYYKVLRFVVVAAAILEIFVIQKGSLSQNGKTGWTLAFSAVAIIFNPVLPLEMERESWVWFDVLATGVFFGFGFPELKAAYLNRQSQHERGSDVPHIASPEVHSEGAGISSQNLSKNGEPENKFGCFYFAFAGVIFIMSMAFVVGMGAQKMDKPRYPIPDFSKYSTDTLNERRREDMGNARSAPATSPLEAQAPQPTVRKADPVEMVDGVEVRKAVPVETPEVRRAIPVNSAQ